MHIHDRGLWSKHVKGQGHKLKIFPSEALTVFPLSLGKYGNHPEFFVRYEV